MLRRLLSDGSMPRRIFRILRREGLMAVVQRVRLRRNSHSSERWLANFLPNEEEVLRQRYQLWPASKPRIGVVIPLALATDGRRLHSAIWSALRQTYPHMEIIGLRQPGDDVWRELAARRNLPGDWPTRIRIQTLDELRDSTDLDYLAVLHPEDNLEIHALWVMARAILSQSSDVFYSDEAFTTPNLEIVRRLSTRSAFSLDRWLSSPEIENLVCFRFGMVAGLNSRSIAHPIARMAALLVQNPRLTHVADFLYRRRYRSTETETPEMVHAALEGVMRHRGDTGSLRTVSEKRNIFAPVRALPPDYRVAVIIPTRNGLRLVKPCVESLERTLPAKRADIVLIDHESDDPECVAWLAEAARKHTVVPYKGVFNFAAIMNFAVKSLSKPYTHYLLLNNDTEAPRAGWLEEMVQLSLGDDVGMVGATLVYPGPTIQHAGVVLELQGSCGHSHRFTPLKNPAPAGVADWPGELAVVRECSAVTAACCLIPAEVWAEVGGMNEAYRVVYNDIDLCLRIRAAGYRILQTPHALLYHYECQTRGETDKHPGDSAAFMDEYGATLEAGDPFYSPYLSRITPQQKLAPALRWSWAPKCRTVALPRTRAAVGRKAA